MQSLAAALEEHSISPLPSLHPSVPSVPSLVPSLSLPPDSNDAGKAAERSPHHPPTHTHTPERERETWRRRGNQQAERRGEGADVGAGSEGAARTGGVEEMDGRERGINGKEREGDAVVVMGLMCNKLQEGAFREALFSSPTHTHTNNSELCMTHNLIHIYESSNRSRLH